MLTSYLKTAADIFLPRLCFSCETKITGGSLCPDCRERIQFLYPPLCRFCSLPIYAENTTCCPACQQKTPYYNRLISVAADQDPLNVLIRQFSDNHCDWLAKDLALLMAGHLRETEFMPWIYNFITAVPTPPAQTKERGYNPAALLAKELAKVFKIPYLDDIIYAGNSSARLDELGIILVDTVFFGAGPINENALKLKTCGAKRVTALTLARSMRQG